MALAAHDVLLAAVWHSGAPSVHRDQASLTATDTDADVRTATGHDDVMHGRDNRGSLSHHRNRSMT